MYIPLQFVIREMLLRCNFLIFVILTTFPMFATSRICNGIGDNGSNPNPQQAILSQTENPKTENQIRRPRNRCCPYDFDSSLCRIVDDKVLCGFNRNVGYPNSNDAVKDLEGGCRLRGGRLECGYLQGPYTNIRRPPAWYEAPADKEEELQSAERFESEEINKAKLKLHVSTSTRKYKVVTRCVEILKRIVCKNM